MSMAGRSTCSCPWRSRGAGGNSTLSSIDGTRCDGFPAAAELDCRLRHANASDAAFFAILYASTRRAEMAATGWSQAVQDAFLAQQHDAQHRHYRALHAAADWWVIEHSGDPAGRLILQDDGRELLIVDLALLPPYRNRAIGIAILSDIRDFADAEGRAVRLSVAVTNPARSLYERMDYVPVEDGGMHIQMRYTPPSMR